MDIAAERAVLEQAAALVEQGWCQAAAARSADGEACEPGDGEAVAWSACGAIERAAQERLRADQACYLDMVHTGLHAVVAVVADLDPVPTSAGAEAFDSLLARLCDWNDEAPRTAQEVSAALRAAAAGQGRVP